MFCNDNGRLLTCLALPRPTGGVKCRVGAELLSRILAKVVDAKIVGLQLARALLWPRGQALGIYLYYT